MTQQPGACPRPAEAGHPAGEPGVAQQQPRRPTHQQRQQTRPDPPQHEGGVGPEQKWSEGSEEQRHPESAGLSPAVTEKKPFMLKEFQHSGL